MTGSKISIFLQIAKRKGWTLTDIGDRWGVSERQMTRISNSGNQRDIDAVNGLPDLTEDNMNDLASYLGITDAQLEELNLEFHEDTGSSGEMVYSYYFYVPDNTPQKILEITGWKPGQLINGIPVNVFDEEDSDYEQ